MKPQTARTLPPNPRAFSVAPATTTWWALVTVGSLTAGALTQSPSVADTNQHVLLVRQPASNLEVAFPGRSPSGSNPRTPAGGVSSLTKCGGCVYETLAFEGASSPTSGTPGNIRTFTGDAVSVNASAFSRTSSGTWSTAYLGQYSGGLGVTDTSEGSGGDNSHTVDNIGQVNYVLFEFSTPVLVDRAFLGYVVDDSDLSVWFGTTPDPFNHHLTLGDTLLDSLGSVEENFTSSSDPRWADLNAGQVIGNTLVIAALASDTSPEDEFKISHVELCVPPAPDYDYGDLEIAGTSFNTTGGGVPADAPRHQLTGTLLLGVARDAEGNGQPTPAADGDDTHGSPDDEDGAAFGALSPGQPSTITITVAGAGGQLNAWVDWNHNGSFDGSEQIAADLSLPAGGSPLLVNVPLDAVTETPLAARFRISSAGGDAATTGTATDGEIEDYTVTVTAPEYCIPETFVFTGSGPTDGPDGNVRTFTQGGVSVNITAFSRTSAGVWEAAYLGLYGSGLGVTDTGETGDGNSHTVDNVGRVNYVLFEFSAPVIVERAYLGYVVDDSDLTAWIGSFDDPYHNHLTLSDAQLASFDWTEDNTTTSSSTRWAELNANERVGNALVIAAWTGDATPEDMFKIEKLDVCKLALAAIGNYVWNDINDDGLVTTDGPYPEVGLDGVGLELWRLDDAGELVPTGLTTVSSGGGFYLFSDLLPGTYQVRVPTPPPAKGWSSHTTDEADNQEDNDDNGIQPPNQIGAPTVSPPIELSPGETDLTIDFGFLDPSIGNLVWHDADNDGQVDPEEPGIPGVTLELYQVAPDNSRAFIRTTATDANGFYIFGGLPPGDYQIDIPESNFEPLGALYERRLSSTPTGTADDLLDDDDNGTQSVPGGRTVSPVVNLLEDLEPVDSDLPPTPGFETGRGKEMDNSPYEDIDGDMTVDFGFRASPPTAVALESFRAVTTSAGGVRLQWRTLVEFDLVGFHLARACADGRWERITSALIPATGLGWLPQRYALTDAGTESDGAVRYQLIEVALNGQERVVRETTIETGPKAELVRADGTLTMRLGGQPNASLTVETTTNLTDGPWLPVATLRLDTTGAGQLLLPTDLREAARFYRACEP